MTISTGTHRLMLDQAVADLRLGAGTWAATSLEDRIALLERLMPRVLAEAEAMVASASTAKGYPPDSPWASEDWANGPWAIAQNISAYLHVLQRLQKGKDPVPPRTVHDRRGRTVVDVFPATPWDRLLLNGFRAEVWMAAGTTRQIAVADAADAYRGRPCSPGVSLVLGAGNVAAITALDILHMLYAEGHVVIAKMNPVNAYMRSHFEAIFVEFVDSGWVRFVDGGAEQGQYLTGHDGVDAVHVTGSAATHDAIVWGTDEEAALRRRDDEPLLAKPFTSELGGVSPCIVVPGRWSEADLRFQAEHIVTSKLNNAGHNCIATQVLVLSDEWEGSDALLEQIRDVLATLPPRPDYYPGADRRVAGVVAAHPDAEPFGDQPHRLLVRVDPDEGSALLDDEVFASALGVVRVPGSDPQSFLAAAVAFANDRLPGTLGATLIVDPATEKSHPAAVESAIRDLRFGTVGVNVWSGVGFLLGYTPWGAYPGHSRHDVGSGVGFVHNAFMLKSVEKTVLRAPFAPTPRGMFSGSPSISPKPPYFATNRTGGTTIRRVTRFTTRPSLFQLPAIFASALRG
jgi:acyl-CoA reductase-like NAD-dependent aldehyde dehydrogenase